MLFLEQGFQLQLSIQGFQFPLSVDWEAMQKKPLTWLAELSIYHALKSLESGKCRLGFGDNNCALPGFPEVERIF